MKTIEISKKQLLFEILAIVLTVTGKFVFMDYLNWRFPFVLTTSILWFSYIIFRSRTTPNILTYWGFRIDNFKSVLMKVLPFGLLAVVSFFVIGYYQETINMTWHIIPILIFYPIWGTIQQFLMVGLIAGNLKDLELKNVNNFIIILFTAILFAVVHYPENWLIAGTFLLALFYTFIYLKEKNLYVLGLFHGWLGALFYYTVLDKDPFLDTFGKIFNLS